MATDTSLQSLFTPLGLSLVYLPLTTSQLNVCEQWSALMRLCTCTVSSEPSLLTNVFCTKFSWTDLNCQLTIPHIPWVVLWSFQYNITFLPWLQIHHSTAYSFPSSLSLVYLPLSTSPLNVSEQRSALMRLCGSTVSSEPSLLTNVISTNIHWP